MKIAPKTTPQLKILPKSQIFGRQNSVSTADELDDANLGFGDGGIESSADEDDETDAEKTNTFREGGVMQGFKE